VSSELKREFLELLEKDVEFRYAVAGYLGLSEILKRLDSVENEIKKVWEEIRALREDMNKGFKDIKDILHKVDVRLSRVERTVEGLTLAVEEEALDVVSYLLSKRGISMRLSSLRVNERLELDIYGSDGGVTLAGEAKVKASQKFIDKLLARIEEAMKLKPEAFKGKVIPVLYCLRFVGDPEYAGRRGVWLIVSGRELTQPPL